ncbi:MAG: DNA-processing protein DprA [Candidatus Gastranaerophilales bacterium]|nr:DNA-processing protein DprA [Candidatus Gastranaerophilales bacterium]
MQGKLNFEENPDKNKFYLGMSHILVNNPLFKAKIFEFFNFDIIRTFKADKEDLNQFSQMYPNIKIPNNFLNELRNINLDDISSSVQKSKTKYITYEDKNYPEPLRNIEDFPVTLFYKGSFDKINFEKTLAVVGSRKATESAKLNTSRIISGFKNTDIVIISGLAEGIDTSAHKAALENNLKTIAVIGSGLNFTYPHSNKKLYQDIENNGGIIFSEYPNDFAPLPQNFPQRNRLVCGLSKGVLITEAKKHSGAMISARIALEQGKELMCMPGLITNPNCEGIYHLIKNGAWVVTKTEDILNILNWEIINENKARASLSGIEKQILELISLNEISIEGLNIKLDIGINELMIKLTEMELSGLIVQKNGLYYISGN